MLADTVSRVVFQRSDCGNAGLRAAAPGELVDIIAGSRVAYEDAISGHALEVFCSFGVHGIIIGVDPGIQIDLGFRYMQKAPRLASGTFSRFLAGEDIVRWC